jgi:hypothetical protein
MSTTLLNAERTLPYVLPNHLHKNVNLNDVVLVDRGRLPLKTTKIYTLIVSFHAGSDVEACLLHEKGEVVGSFGHKHESTVFIITF